MIIGETEKNNMVFSSLNFMFVFLPIVFGIYFISPRKIRNFILFIASLVFYAWGEPFYVVLMLFSTILNFVYGALVQKYKGKTSAKWILASSVVLNLGILGFLNIPTFYWQYQCLVWGVHSTAQFNTSHWYFILYFPNDVLCH